MKATKILIAGDLMPMPCNYDLFTAGDAQALFGEKICELFASADFAYAILRAVLPTAISRSKK